jgi:hypothetical protein
MLYPTLDALEKTEEPLHTPDGPHSTVMIARANRRRPINMNHLSYQEQKEFFRLDKEYD